ncbi:MAG: TolC family protein [Ignavibacteria bacterium]|jgi:outer membrane protein TolC|nr:TolC family protein [Ignavibacteria bacterium]MCU7504879.1 TolC family protein [Ignavibacteria bacterium]MCU7517835.1 TolC family protein [Ignavibacteria bacterium]
MKKIKSIVFLSFVFYASVFGQKYSLKHCLDYAKQSNSNIKMAYLDSKVSDEVVNEQIGRALPQISISGTIDDKLLIPTQMLPGEIAGRPGTFVPVKFGTQYSATAGISLTQKIYDPSLGVALKAAKLSRELSEQNVRKTDEQTLYNVSAAFYRALVVKKQLDNLKVILSVSQKNLDATQQKYENGLVKKIEVDKIKVTFNNTNSQVNQIELAYKQALNNLKFTIGMPVDSTIALTDDLPDELSALPEASNSKDFVESRIEYQMQQSTISLYEADRQNNIAAYYPSLSFYANYNYAAQRSEFDFLKGGKDWYTNSSIGVQLSVPVFSGFQRYAKVQESELNLEKAKENLKLTEQSIMVELSNYYIQYRNAIDNIKNEKENLELAESVYKNTQAEFSQGVSSSMDLIQTESTLRETQNNYFSKLLNLYIAKLDLEKSRGNLINFLNNIK